MVRPFLPDETQLVGLFSGDADVSWRSDGSLPTGRVALKGRGVKVTQDVQGNALPIAFDTLNLNAGMRDGRAELDWLLRIANNGQFDGKVQIGDPQKRRTLSGNININNISLALLNPALMRGEKWRAYSAATCGWGRPATSAGLWSAGAARRGYRRQLYAGRFEQRQSQYGV